LFYIQSVKLFPEANGYSNGFKILCNLNAHMTKIISIQLMVMSC